MAYEMVMPYHLHMPSYFLETFTEYPYTFIIEYPSVSGRYFYGTAEDGFEIRLEWVDGRSIRKKVS